MRPHRPALTVITALLLAAAPVWAAPAALRTEPARAAGSAAPTGFDGVVEAVRQTVVAAQVAGAIVQLDAKVGDRVAAGQVLLRIDARSAEQTAAAGDAQVMAARAALGVAAKDVERQRQLFAQNYISQSALDRAEAEFKATQAQVNAQIAQAGAARTQSGQFVVRAPFAGVVSAVPVAMGDMAMPGRALVTLYDPAALRITAAVPQAVAAAVTAAGPLPRAEFPGLPAAQAWVTPTRLQTLPTVDPASLTMQLRAELPGGLAGVVPGMFARLWLAPAAAGATRGAANPTVPVQAIVRRAEMTGLYVIGATGQPLLRQVRLGRSEGDRVEVLSGLAAGEQVATDSQAAARATRAAQ